MSKSVVIDIGHGGRDPGAIGKTTYEKNNNLTLGLKVGKILQQHGITVNYTRTTDKDFCSGVYDENVDLQNRIAIAKQYNPDVFLSCHNNSFNHSAKGIETHCFKSGGTDIQLATSIYNQMASILGMVNRGIKVSDFYVLRKFDKTNTSACLVEYGFIDSEEDVILSKMDIASIAISKGILGFLGIAYLENAVVVPIPHVEPSRSSPPTQTSPTKQLPLLKLGMNNSSVGELQTLLNSKGYSPLIIDNDFGQKTLSTVMQFQRDNQLQPDGIVGNLSWSKLLQKTVLAPVKSLNFSYSNNARCTAQIPVKDGNGNLSAGHFVSAGDIVTVINVSYSRQLIELEYPVSNGGVRSGFVSVSNNIIYLSPNAWHNGSTSENTYNDANKNLKIGSLSPYEYATPLYKKNGFIHLVYNTNKGVNSKSGYSEYMGGL